MERITIALDDELSQVFEQYIEKKGYRSRSEAIRDMIRNELDRTQVASKATGTCFASLSYLYDYSKKNLIGRLDALRGANHDLYISGANAFLEGKWCYTTSILHGTPAKLQSYANRMIIEREVFHGHVHMVAMNSTKTPVGKK